MIIYMLDDSKNDLLILRRFVEKYAKELAGVEFEIHAFLEGKEMVKLYEQAEEKPYLMFLDILMEGDTGIDIAKSLRAKGYDGRIIFATSSDKHMMDAFAVYADGYICKPFKYEDVKNAMDRMKVRFMNESRNIKVRSDRAELMVKVADIIYVESENHSVIIHLKDDELIKANNSLSEIAQMLANETNFTACGRSYFINFNYVDEVTKETFELSNGESILIPVRIRKQMQLDFNSYKVGN